MKIKKITSLNKKDVSSHKCYLCGGKLILSTEPITYKGKTIYVNGEKCQKCSEFFSSLEGSDRVRQELNPTLFDRIKNFFTYSKNRTDKSESPFFGKVL